MENPFWEETYKDDSISTFGVEPNPTLARFTPLFPQGASILDIGCGDGKNALYLAQQGSFQVEAFDISESAVARLYRTADKQQLRVSAWAQDLRQFVFAKLYDGIISFGTLHFVEIEEWKTLLLHAKEHTSPGGMHVIQIFTNQLPASPDIAPYAVGLADDGALATLYNDWEILLFQSYTFEDVHPGVPKHFHASNKIVARKPG